MKNIIFPKGWITIVLGSLISLNTFSQTNTVKTETFAVKGNCEMCQSRIENAADIKGVKICKWDVKKKVATVTYNIEKTSLEQIQKAIAAKGYEAGEVKADEAAYKKLPGCCKYNERDCKEKK
jgi:mercuric ion binding protein